MQHPLQRSNCRDQDALNPTGPAKKPSPAEFSSAFSDLILGGLSSAVKPCFCDSLRWGNPAHRASRPTRPRECQRVGGAGDLIPGLLRSWRDLLIIEK